MKKLLTIFLSVYGGWKKFIFRLKGKKQDDIHSQRIVSGKAWNEFCDTIKAAGNSLYIGKSPKDPFNQSEGLRYLSRLTRVALDAFIEHSDPEFPTFKRMVDETVKMGADNPDNYYMNAQISGKYEYRITGRRNSVQFLSFSTKNGNYGSSGGLAPCASLNSTELNINADGSFEIILSKDQKGQNWLKVDETTSIVIVRQTFMDKSREKAAGIKIERIGGKLRPANVTPQRINEGLNVAGMFVAGAMHYLQNGPTIFRNTAIDCRCSIRRFPELPAGKKILFIIIPTGNWMMMKFC